MEGRYSIATQILVAVIVTVVVVLGISSVIELNILKKREVQRLYERGRVKADRISNTLSYPLWNLNHPEIDRAVLDELGGPEVSAVLVFDERGQLYVGKVKSSDGTIQDIQSAGPSAAPLPASNGYSYIRDIRFNDNRIGSVRVDVSTAYLQPEIDNLRWGIAIKLLLLVVVLSVVLLITLRVLVVRRLSALKSWIEGPQARSSPPQFKYSKEINSLAEAFGNMSMHLRSKHEELEGKHARLIELNNQLQKEIEDRQQAEQALRESENRFAQITENISEILWLNTPDYSSLLYISPSYEAVWGKSTGSLYENPYSFLESIHPEDREWVSKRIRAEKDKGFSVEYRIVKPNGEVRWIWDRGFPIKDEAGVVQRLAGIAEDITERKQAQEDLRRYADRVRDLYNNAPCGYHSLDEEGYYVQINDTELSWLGRKREEVVGKLRFSDVLIPEQLPYFEEKYQQFMTEGVSRDIEYQIRSRDGSIRTVLLSATASKNAAGKFVMSRATLYDITDRRRAEELVEHSEEKFSRAFRSSPAGMTVTRLSDGKFLEINDAALSFLGYTREEVIGGSTLSLNVWPNSDDRRNLIDEITQHGAIRGREITFLAKNGTEILCYFSGELIEVNGESCILSVLLDITERRYMEQALKANEELLRLFVKHTPAAIAMFDNNMNYLQVSDRFLTDYHLEGQNIIGKCHYDVFPNIPDRWKEVHRRILAGAIERDDEDPYIDHDGKQGWLAWESLPWRKADGSIGGLILFTQVITERKRAENALRASEERFAKIFNLSPYRMGIVRAADRVVLDVNDCWVKETGFSREETVNHVIDSLVPWLPDDSQRLLSLLVDETKLPPTFEAGVRTKSGELRYVLSSLAVIDIDGEPCYLWAAQDITERKLVEEERRQLIHELGERVKELTALQKTARVLQDEAKTVPELLQAIVALLPPAWQYPEVTGARIRFGDLEFKTNGFVPSPWSQLVEFGAGDQKGEIEVVYTEERPVEKIGPFLDEELNLINSLAEMISSALNRRSVQEALQESEEAFRTLTENVSAGIFIYRDSKFIYVNPMAGQLTGYSRNELLGKNLFELIHPDFRDAVAARIVQRELGLSPSQRFENKILTKSGEERWMDVSSAGTTFHSEKAVIVTAFDITGRKRAEEELQRGEERYRTLFETSPDAVGVFDAKDRVIMANERGRTLFGFDPDGALTDMDSFVFIAPEDRNRVRSIFKKLKQNGKLVIFECLGLRRDGERFDLECRANLIPNVEGQPPLVLMVSTDITQRKAAEKALRVSEVQLRALSAKVQSAREEEGTRIAREIHDELGGALTGLKWDLEGVESRLVNGNGDATISDVRKQISAMTGLIESTITTVRRISSELRPGVLDDLGLVAAIEWQAQQFQRRTGLHVDWRTNLETADISRDGATAVFRIFQEVLTNVLRHSQASNIYVGLRQTEAELELEVVDDGRGITEDEQKNARSLGILGIKERALLVGGQVTITGFKGKGTTVLVRIPLSYESESQPIA